MVWCEKKSEFPGIILFPFFITASRDALNPLTELLWGSRRPSSWKPFGYLQRDAMRILEIIFISWECLWSPFVSMLSVRICTWAPQQTYMGGIITFSLEGHWSLEKLRNLPKTLLCLSGNGGLQTQIFPAPNPVFMSWKKPSLQLSESRYPPPGDSFRWSSWNSTLRAGDGASCLGPALSPEYFPQSDRVQGIPGGINGILTSFWHVVAILNPRWSLGGPGNGLEFCGALVP